MERRRRRIGEYPYLKNDKLVEEAKGIAQDLMEDLDELKRELRRVDKEGLITGDDESLFSQIISQIRVNLGSIELLLMEMERRGWDAPTKEISNGVSKAWKIVDSIDDEIPRLLSLGGNDLRSAINNILNRWGNLKNICANKIRAKVEALRPPETTPKEEIKRLLKMLLRATLRS